MINNFHFLLKILSRFLFSFGENPARMMIWVFFFVSVFAVNIYSFNEIAKLKLDKSSVDCNYSNMSIVISSCAIDGECIKNELIKNNLFNSFYISLVTFTTLGYGDYHPLGWCKLYLAAEALIGAIMLALFVLTLGRRTAGR